MSIKKIDTDYLDRNLKVVIEMIAIQLKNGNVRSSASLLRMIESTIYEAIDKAEEETK